HLLKFLAILPSLDHDTKGVEVKRILIEALRRMLSDSRKAKALKKKGQDQSLPRIYILIVQVALFFIKLFPAGVLSKLVRASVRLMAKRFIAGESIDTAQASFSALFDTKRDVTLDQLGELVVSEKEADNYCSEVIKLIQGFGQHIPHGEKNQANILRAHVSIKVSALCSDFKPEAFEHTYNLVAPRLIKILSEAKQHRVFINIDAEHYDYRDIVFKIYSKVLLETENLKDFADTGIVLQAYLRDAYPHLLEIVELAKKRNLIMPIRLVKGAYWDAETVEADAHSFDAPEFLNKEETDIHFRQLIYKTYENYPHIQLCLASHNYADHCFARVLREKKFPETPHIEHQCLHMTYEALSTAMANLGWCVRNYVPIGSLLVGMAYLVRRIMENSSQVGVLTMMRSHKKKTQIKFPTEIHKEKKELSKVKYDQSQFKIDSDFFNITPLRLYIGEEKDSLYSEFVKYKETSLGQFFHNAFIFEGEEQSIYSSSDPELLVGKIKFAKEEDAKKAIEVADNSYLYGSWSRADWITRSSIMIKAADIMLMNRNRLSALIVYEAGKSFSEALADVDEAIDFLNFYSREERKYDNSSGRGVVAAITPWNFPLAIPCGMSAAPLVAGNSVILKSAEQTPLIANEFVSIMYQAGVPKDALIHLPGLGEVVGNTLVESLKVSDVVFTGSRAVGTMIASKVSKRLYENKFHNITFPARAITEMGGKNAVIVTANAELDETVSGILYSAFAHAGQKCSAASRVIVDNSIKSKFIERLKEATLDIHVGEAFHFHTAINPVISAQDQKRLRKQVEDACYEANQFGGNVIVDRSQEDLPGYCVGPSIIELPAKRALLRESYAQIELFGPVVHIIGYDNLNQALEIYNSTPYALTGGVFSQSQDDIDYLTAKMESGNIYINRSITGARVAIEPFGGFKMSGTGPNAGSKSYLKAFHYFESSDITKNVMSVDDVTEGEGSDFLAIPAVPNKIPLHFRIEKVSKGIDRFLYHYESLVGELRPNEKEVFAKYLRWVQKNSQHFITKEHSNRKIPGQLSYNNYLHSHQHCIVLSWYEVPELSTVLWAFSALVAGTGLTILARNEEAFNFWSNVSRYFHQSGVAKNTFEVYYSNLDQTQKCLSSKRISNIILDAPVGMIEKYNDIIFPDDIDSEYMRKVFYTINAPDILDFKSFCRDFIHIRSFAVNTMRHGAPMEIEL
ncbi:bifunctional proline dehydrogenase/L-glutamate gamma-semialdehyde dehydrogenase, partial [Bacteriovoracaceae bacterium]|nr:bifunctional proline dehydrogenase/L-glutamate gamma-semialdehyde dehydrogenase [Bacteriovoracaceae bacterium]